MGIFEEKIDKQAEQAFYDNMVEKIKSLQDIDAVEEASEQLEEFYTKMCGGISYYEGGKAYELKQMIEKKAQEVVKEQFGKYNDQEFTKKYEEAKSKGCYSKKFLWISENLEERMKKINSNIVNGLAEKLEQAETQGDLEKEKIIIQEIFQTLRKSDNPSKKISEFEQEKGVKLSRNYGGVDFENETYGITERKQKNKNW